MANKEATLLIKIKEAGAAALDKVSGAVSSIAKVGAAAFATLSAVVIKAVGDFREQEKAVNSLTQAMVNNGVYSKELKDRYLEQASALQKLTTFGDEQIIAAQAALQQQIGSLEVTKELTTAVLDFAGAQGITAAQAAETIGKSIGTSTNALARYGIEIDTAASAQQKMSMVIDGLNSKFGGQAVAAAQGLGAIDQLKNSVSDLFEVLGERLAPVITLVAKSLNDLANDTGNTAPIIDAFVSVLGTLSRMGAYVYNSLVMVAEIVGVGLVTAIEASTEALSGNFSRAKIIASTGMDEVGKITADRKQALANQLAAIDEAFAVKQQENLSQEEQRLSQSLERQKQVRQANYTETRTKQLEKMLADQEMELALIGATEEQKLAIEAQFWQKKLQDAKTAQDKLAAQQKLHNTREKQIDMAHKKDMQNLDLKFAQGRVDVLSAAANLMVAIAGQENKTAFLASRAAAIAQSIISTRVAVVNALASVPFPANIGVAADMELAGNLNTAAIAATTIAGLAEGGIVRARPGGSIFRIGEAGQDEAVIPLDDVGDRLGGTVININVNGGLLGNEQQAFEFARAVDRELLKLRQNNASVAFDRVS